MDGNVVTTDRLDPLKLTDIGNSAISFIHKVRDQIKSLTRDIVFPHGKPIARVSSQAPVAVKTEDQNATEGDAEVGDNDDTMGADYDVEPGKDDAQFPETMAIGEEDGEDSSLLRMYGASFTLPFAKRVCKTASKAVKEPSAVFSAEG